MSEQNFRLTIEMGNDAMQYALDVARALREVAEKIEGGSTLNGNIRDENGNTVGHFSLNHSPLVAD